MEISTWSSVVNCTFLHSSLTLPRGCSAHHRADGLPLRCKGQRVYWAKILWVCAWLQRGEVYSSLPCTHMLTPLKPFFFFFFLTRGDMVFQLYGHCTWDLEEGLYFTDGKADVGCGVFNHMSWFWWVPEKEWNVKNSFSHRFCLKYVTTLKIKPKVLWFFFYFITDISEYELFHCSQQ